MDINSKIAIRNLREQGKTYREIADIFEVSKQRIHQILTQPHKPKKERDKFHGAYCGGCFLLVKRSFKGLAKITDTLVEDSEEVCWMTGCIEQARYNLYYRRFTK